MPKLYHADELPAKEYIQAIAIDEYESKPYMERLWHLATDKKKHEKTRKRYLDELSRIYGAECTNCNSTKELTIDHIIPVSLGGCTTWDNLQILCRSCNSSKRDSVGGINA